MKNWLMNIAVCLVSGALGFTLFKKLGAPETAVMASRSAATNGLQASSVAVATPSKPKGLATTLPEFSLLNKAGEKQSIQSWPGKSLIVNFWATWCAPCRKEIPLLKEINKTEAKNGIQVVGIAIDFRDDVLKYAGEIGIDYPLLMGEQDGLAAAEAFGIESLGLPFTVFTDNQGRVVTLVLGELTKPKMKVLINAVKRVNKGELTPDAAKAVIAKEFLKLPPAGH
jgi:thiol-disulfide isomerase/thioredoxin